MLDDIEIFVKVVDQKGFSAAANLLRLPKSTVSRRVSQMENDLGVKLLNRTTRQLSLTPIGESYYEKCLVILERLEEANDLIKGLQVKPKGRLRLTAPHELSVFYLKDILMNFLKTYPEIVFEFDITNRMVDLVEEGFDLAIRIGQLEDSSLVALKLGTIRGGIYASPDFLKAHGPYQHPSELPRNECIQFRTTQVHTWIFSHDGAEKVEVKPQGRIQVNSMQYVCESAVSGLGIAAITKKVAAPYVHQGKLIEILKDYKLSFADVFAVYPARKFLSPNVRAFIDYVKPFLEKNFKLGLRGYT